MVGMGRGWDRPCRARPADRSLVAEDRSAGGVRDRADRSLPLHGGYTRSRQVEECNGHERSRAVAMNRRSSRQHSHDLVVLQKAGRSSSLPTPREPSDSYPRGGGRPGLDVGGDVAESRVRST
jgi:hypothetical protein